MSHPIGFRQVDLSLIVPTINSELYIRSSLAEMTLVLRDLDGTSEIIAIDDGSTDNTWETLTDLAKTSSDVDIIAVRLASNFGQHAAILCGMRISRGSVVVTIDDDLQQDPMEIPKAIAKLNLLKSEAIIVAYEDQMKSAIRKFGSWITSEIVHLIFGKPRGLKISPLRVMTRPMVEQVCRTTNPNPYITGELFRASGTITNITGIHQERLEGRSNYTAKSLLVLLSRITFGYSTKPLTFTTGFALVVSAIFMITSVLITLSRLLAAGRVPGWASQVLIISIFATCNFFVLAILGTYLKQILQRVSQQEPYSVTESTRQSD